LMLAWWWSDFCN